MDDTNRKGKGKGNGGKGEHEGKGGGVGRKGTQQVENLVMDEVQENMRTTNEKHSEDVKKLVEMMQKEEEKQEEHSGAEWRLTLGLVAHTPWPCRSQKGERHNGWYGQTVRPTKERRKKNRRQKEKGYKWRKARKSKSKRKRKRQGKRQGKRS